MELDGIVISDYGRDSLSATNSLRLKLGDKVGYIQVVLNYLKNGKLIETEIEKESRPSWESAPKLNGIFLLSFLKKRGLNFSLLNNFKEEKEKFTELIKKNPKIILLSTTFIYRKKDLVDAVREIRNLYSDAIIVVGGPFIYSSFLLMEKSKKGNYQSDIASNDYMFLKIDEEPNVDCYVVSPRGEYILLDIIEAVKNNKNFENVSNVAIFRKNKYEFSVRSPEVCKGDDLYVDWEALPQSVFDSKVVPVQASNGCTFNCSFCNFTKEKERTCLKPMELLLHELRQIERRGAKYVWFSDDNFRLGKKDLNEFCHRLIEENIFLKWMSFIRASTLADVDFGLLKKSGCVEVQLGVESASEKILNNMNKKATPDLYRKVIKGLLANRIDCSCYFIFGFPGETEETVAETFDFLKEIESFDGMGSLSWSIFPFLLSPLSPIYEEEERAKYGLSGYMNKWKHCTMSSSDVGDIIKRVFSGLDFSGPIYRGDNLACLERLNAKDKRRFHYTRHRLAKKIAGNITFDFEKELRESFRFLTYEN
jgi:anaerobic magnesium-protoporphyrin IX monomethyl ester cyclase